MLARIINSPLHVLLCTIIIILVGWRENSMKIPFHKSWTWKGKSHKRNYRISVLITVVAGACLWFFIFLHERIHNSSAMMLFNKRCGGLFFHFPPSPSLLWRWAEKRLNGKILHRENPGWGLGGDGSIHNSIIFLWCCSGERTLMRGVGGHVLSLKIDRFNGFVLSFAALLEPEKLYLVKMFAWVFFAQ